MLEEGPRVNIDYISLKTTVKMITNWKTSELDSIYGFWYKTFTFIHDKLATEMNKCLQRTDITERVIQKHSLEGNVTTNYRPIRGLPVTWKILRAEIRKKIPYSLISQGTKRMPQENQRQRGINICRSTHPQRV